MLVLSRKLNEKIVINDDVFITVVGLGNNRVRYRHRGPRLGGDLAPGALLTRAECVSEGHVALATTQVGKKNDVR